MTTHSYRFTEIYWNLPLQVDLEHKKVALFLSCFRCPIYFPPPGGTKWAFSVDSEDTIQNNDGIEKSTC